MAFDTTTDDVLRDVDLSGTTAVVTGGTTGLGRETVRALASAGATVLFSARSTEKGDAVVGEAEGDVSYGLLDLTSLASVRAFADDVRSRMPAIDVLINNAGVMATPFERTADGFELQFGTNHLGHFLLTARLAGAVRGRVVNLTSGGHRASDVHFDDPNYEHRPYEKWEAYGQSKTANILFSVELHRRGVPAFAVHPGMIGTELGRYLTREDLQALLNRVKESATPTRPKPVEAGAATSVWAAVSPDLEGRGGLYLEDCEVSTPEPYALDPSSAERLWTLSEGLVGEAFRL